MQSVRELVALAARLDGTKILSVYLDWSGADPARAEAWRTTLKQRIGALRRVLGHAPHAERAAFESCVMRLLSLLPQVGSPRDGRGWMGFASANGVTLAESLAVAVPTAVAWDDRMRIAPYVAVVDTRPALVVVADHRRAVFYRYERATLTRIEELEQAAHVVVQRPMPDTPRRGFHAGTRGAAARDDAARQLEGAYAQFRAKVRRRIEALDLRGDYVVLGGSPEVVAHVAGDLSPSRRAHTRIAHELGTDATGRELVDGIARAVEALREARLRDEIEETVGMARSGGRAVLGHEPVALALERGAVERLLLTARIISETPDVAERLVRAALARGGHVEVVRGTEAEALERSGDGLAARLRFTLVHAKPSGATVPPPSHAQSA